MLCVELDSVVITSRSTTICKIFIESDNFTNQR